MKKVTKQKLKTNKKQQPKSQKINVLMLPFWGVWGGPGPHFWGPGGVWEGVLVVMFSQNVGKPRKTKRMKIAVSHFYRKIAKNGPNMAAQNSAKFYKMASGGLRERFLWVLKKELNIERS